MKRMLKLRVQQLGMALASLIMLNVGVVTPVHAVTYWTPPLQTSWQWQLTTPVDTTVAANVYDIDLFDNDASVVATLHAQGRKAICYMETGGWENYRPDAASFPDSVKGLPVHGYPDERWLDIRRLDVLGPIMQARLDLCKSKGFDAVEPDLDDGFTAVTGFPLTEQDQVTYNTYIANQAHARGLSIGLKNGISAQSPQFIQDMLPVVDWTLNEQCFQYNECGALLPFVSANKAVLQVEYSLPTSSFCPQANAYNFNSMLKNTSLDAYRVACR